MKGIVVEIKNKYVAVLSDNGSVIKMKNNNYQIGEEIIMKNVYRKPSRKVIAIASAVALAVVTSGTGAYAYTTPYSHVSLDVNPSIEYDVNVFDRVIDATAVNEDGQQILDNISVENKTIEDAIDTTIGEISDQGYLGDKQSGTTIETGATTETGGIVITTSSDNQDKADELAADLQDKVEDVIAEDNIKADVEVLSVGKERVLEARELGVTPGKLNLVQKLQKSAENPDDIVIEDWLNKPVKDIMKETKANREKAKNKTEEAVTNSEDKTNTTKDINSTENPKQKNNENKKDNSKKNDKASISKAVEDQSDDKDSDSNKGKGAENKAANAVEKGKKDK